MSYEPTIYEVIADVVGDSDGADLEALTAAVFDKIDCPEKWRQFFWSMVRNRVRIKCRDKVARGDRGQRTNVTALPVGRAAHTTAITRPQFLRDTIETFGLWGRVPFGAMTVEMHESRIAGQLKLASGVKRDIDKHAEAINRIKASKVTCLNDLPEYGGKVGAA